MIKKSLWIVDELEKSIFKKQVFSALTLLELVSPYNNRGSYPILGMTGYTTACSCQTLLEA